MKASFNRMLARVLQRSLSDKGLIEDARAFLKLNVDGTGTVTEQVITQGNFTIVMLVDMGERPVGIGVSKRNNEDPVDPDVGYNIALTRAIENGLESFRTADERVRTRRRSSGRIVLQH